MLLFLLCIILLAYKNKHLSLSPVPSLHLWWQCNGAFQSFIQQILVGFTLCVTPAQCIQLSIVCLRKCAMLLLFSCFLTMGCNSETLTEAVDQHVTPLTYILWLFKTCHFYQNPTLHQSPVWDLTLGWCLLDNQLNEHVCMQGAAKLLVIIYRSTHIISHTSRHF